MTAEHYYHTLNIRLNPIPVSAIFNFKMGGDENRYIPLYSPMSEKAISVIIERGEKSHGKKRTSS